MIRVTADTNILVSATIIKGNEFKLLKLAKLDKIKLVLSLDILKEFRDVMSRPKFSYPKEFVDDEFSKILEISEIVTPKLKLNVVKDDPDDNKILECAITGKVDFIVSGDNHLLKLKKYKNIKIVHSKDILNKFKSK